MTLAITFLSAKTQKPEIYIGKPELDAYKLTISSDSSEAIAVTQVKIQFPTSIFSVDDIKKMQAAGFTATPAGPYLTLSTAEARKLDASSPICVDLTGVSSEKTAATNDQIRVHINGDIVTTKVFLLNYPVAARELGDVLSVTVLPIAEVFRTPTGKTKIVNVLGLLLKNKQPRDPLVTEPWNGKTPTILASFVYGRGIGALTPDDNAASDPFTAWNIDFSVEETYQNGEVLFEWSAKNPDPGSLDATPIWSLQPNAENTEVLGPQSGASVRFKMSGIATQNIAGSTQLYLQYTNFPGYNDGYFTLDLEKVEPRPTIIYFDGAPNYVPTLGEAVTVKWQTFGVDKVELQFDGETLSSANGNIDRIQGDYTHKIDRNTQFSLLAYNKVTDATPQHSLQWTGHVPDAQITAFSAGAHEPVVGSPVTLSWSTRAARSGEIRSSDGSPYSIPADQLAAGSKQFFPQRATTYTLHVDGEGNPPDRSITLFYLSPGWSTRPMGLNPHAGQGPVLFATDHGLVLVGGQSTNGIFASSDGNTWSQTGIAQFPARDYAAGASHGGKLWIMGGLGAGQPLNDVWSSVDGAAWTQVSVHADWPTRAKFACVSFKGKLWVMGGLDQNLKPLADIWTSEDGVTWTLAASTAPWSARSGLAIAVYRDQLWLFGGLLADGTVSNELWCSSDGVQWERRRTGDRFSAIEGRQQAVLAALEGALYLLGGVNQQGLPLSDLHVFRGESWRLATGPSGDWGLHQSGQAVFQSALWLAGGLVGNASSEQVWAYFPPKTS